jgi:hypothetical protein
MMAEFVTILIMGAGKDQFTLIAPEMVLKQ